MIKKLLRTIKNIVKLANISSNLNVKYITLSYYGKTQNALHHVPYGLQISPPATTDIIALTLSKEGDEENLIALLTDVNNRDSDLEEGEVFLGIPTLTSRVKMLKDGSIQILDNEGQKIVVDPENKKVEFIDAGGNTIRMDGKNSKMYFGISSPELMVLGETFKTFFNSHTHTTPSGPSGPPVSLMTAAQLSAKNYVGA